MQDGDCLVFVEVRVRSRSPWTGPAESVDRGKQQRLVRAAALFESRHPEMADMPMRFDVVAIERLHAGQAQLNWIRDAFRPGD